MVETRQDLALLPAMIGLGFDAQGVRESALRDLFPPALAQLEAHTCQSGPQLCRCKIVHPLLSLIPGSDFIVNKNGFDDVFAYLVDHIQKTSICS